MSTWIFCRPKGQIINQNYYIVIMLPYNFHHVIESFGDISSPHSITYFSYFIYVPKVALPKCPPPAAVCPRTHARIYLHGTWWLPPLAPNSTSELLSMSASDRCLLLQLVAFVFVCAHLLIPLIVMQCAILRRWDVLSWFCLTEDMYQFLKEKWKFVTAQCTGY